MKRLKVVLVFGARRGPPRSVPRITMRDRWQLRCFPPGRNPAYP